MRNTPTPLPYFQVPFSVPEIPLVFRGHTQQDREVPKSLISNLRIHCPLLEGSALITFDDPKGELMGSLRREVGRIPSTDPVSPPPSG